MQIKGDRGGWGALIGSLRGCMGGGGQRLGRPGQRQLLSVTRGNFPVKSEKPNGTQKCNFCYRIGVKGEPNHKCKKEMPMENFFLCFPLLKLIFGLHLFLGNLKTALNILWLLLLLGLAERFDAGMFHISISFPLNGREKWYITIKPLLSEWPTEFRSHL